MVPMEIGSRSHRELMSPKTAAVANSKLRISNVVMIGSPGMN
jgi:hypothetical protein